MDHSFNLIHGSGAALNDETMKDPTTTTAREIQKNCPDINHKVIRYFTKVKYFAKMFRGIIKDVHFSNKSNTGIFIKNKIVCMSVCITSGGPIWAFLFIVVDLKLLKINLVLKMRFFIAFLQILGYAR